MQVTLRRLGDITRQTEAVVRAGKSAHTTVIRRKTTTLKNADRRKVTARLGAKMGNTIRSEVFPATGIAANPKGRVFSSAIYKRAGGLADLITVFRLGAVIHPVKGLFLAVGRRVAGVRSSTKADLKGRRFAKVKQVTIVPRIADLDAEYARVTASLEADIVNEYDRQVAKIGTG